MLQSVQFNMVAAQQHISNLIDIITNQCDLAEEYFKDGIPSKARHLANKLGIELVLPRVCSRQTYRDKTTFLHLFITHHGFAFPIWIG
nr:hypothetical protein BgiMline_023142 [Biomphalaria glabrata]